MNLIGAEVLYARGLKHIREFQTSVILNELFSINCVPNADGTFSHFLEMDHAKLWMGEVIVADAVNNLRHALDHVITTLWNESPASVTEGGARSPAYPLHADEAVYQKETKKLKKHLRHQHWELICSCREGQNLQMLEAFRDISNEVKHRAMGVLTAVVSQVEWHLEGSGPQVVRVPEGCFKNYRKFEVLRSTDPFKAKAFKHPHLIEINTRDVSPAVNLDQLLFDAHAFVRMVIDRAQHLLREDK